MAPMREAVQQLAHSPVFVDESGSRRAWVMWSLGVAGALCMGYVLLLGFSLAGGPVNPGDLLPLPGLRQSSEQSAVPTRPSPTVVNSPTAPPETGVGEPSAGPSGGVPTGGVGTAPTTTPTGSGSGGGLAPIPSASPQSTSSPAPAPSSPAPAPSSPPPATSSPTPSPSPPPTPVLPGVAPSASLGVAVPSPSLAGSVSP